MFIWWIICSIIYFGIIIAIGEIREGAIGFWMSLLYNHMFICGNKI